MWHGEHSPNAARRSEFSGAVCETVLADLTSLFPATRETYMGGLRSQPDEGPARAVHMPMLNLVDFLPLVERWLRAALSRGAD